MRKSLILSLCCFLLSGLLAQESKPQAKVLKNADMVLMTQNHFDDEMLVKLIAMSDTDFDVSSDALIELKNQGVSPAVMHAMLDAAQRKKQAAQTAQAPAPVTAAPASTPPPSSTNASSPGSMNSTMPTASPMAAGMMTGGISPQQMAAMQSAMAMGGMSGMGGMGGMFGSMMGSYSAEQMPHVLLMGEANKKEEVAYSTAQIGQTKYKGNMGAGGMALRSLATEGLSFAAMGAGPGGMMAMSAFSMASGFMPGMRPGAPTMTYVWGLPGRKAARELGTASPMFELSYGNIPGVDPDGYEPVLLKLYLTKDNYRLVGATQMKMDAKHMMGGGGGPESGKWISEERWPIRLDKEERGFYILHVTQALDPGEYAVVLRPVKNYKASAVSFGGGAQVFYSVWDFSVPGTPPDENGKKKKKRS